MNDGRLLTATFCDDIRQEVGFKHSLMGCYAGGELVVDTVPSMLPKLCAFITLITPLKKPLKKCTIRALYNEEVIAENIFPDNNFPKEQDFEKFLTPTDTRYALNIQMNFIPLLVEKDSILRIEAETEEGIILGSRLVLRKRRDDDLATNQ